MIIFLYLAWLVLGLALGFLVHKLSILFIKKRVGIFHSNILLNAKYSAICWALLNGTVWLGSIIIFGLKPLTVEFLIMFSLCLILSVVDISIRKIPNELLLIISVISLIFLIVNGGIGTISDRFIGLVVGVVVFLLPMIVGRSAGAGDIKLAGVIGFCLGTHDMFVAYIFMFIPLLIYTAYIYATKKGSIKSKVALGSFMAIGFVMVFVLKLLGFNY